MIAIIDYNCGNTASVLNMIKKCGGNGIITNDPEKINKAEKIILPGVGSFDYGIDMLNKNGLIDLIIDSSKNKSILGICLGMQLLCKKSEEGVKNGLGLIDAEVLKFRFENNLNLPVPHVGWNNINVIKENKIINKPENFGIQKFYFVHSYYVKCKEISNVICMSNYGIEFNSVIGNNNNIFGVQFHPEKSHKYGMNLIKNFIKI